MEYASRTERITRVNPFITADKGAEGMRQRFIEIRVADKMGREFLTLMPGHSSFGCAT